MARNAHLECNFFLMSDGKALEVEEEDFRIGLDAVMTPRDFEERMRL